MHYDVQERDGIRVVRVEGELTDAHQHFVEVLTNMINGPADRIVLNLAAVPFINSVGISQLVRLTAQANTQEARLVIAQPSPFVEGVLQTTQLNRFFEVFPTCDEAVRALT